MQPYLSYQVLTKSASSSVLLKGGPALIITKANSPIISPRQVLGGGVDYQGWNHTTLRSCMANLLSSFASFLASFCRYLSFFPGIVDVKIIVPVEAMGLETAVN